MWRRNRPGNRPKMEWRPKIGGSLGSASGSQNDKSSVTTGESFVEDMAFQVKDFKSIPSSLDDDDDDDDDSCKKVKQLGDISQNDDHNDDDNENKNENDDDGSCKKVKQLGDISQNDDDNENKNENDDDDDVNGGLKHPVFDICPKRGGSAVKLKPSLLAMNREKRKQMKQAKKGENIIILRPGMVLMKGYISSDDQVSIVKTCRDLGIADGGFYQPGYISGTKLHLHMMCLGKNWDPDAHKYTEFRVSDKSKPPGIPEKFSDLVKKSIQDSNEFIRAKLGGSDKGEVVPDMSPDICIVNFYTKTGRLGLHQDKDESEKSLKKGLPVVSFSIGDSAEFLYGETRSIDEADKVILESGDVLVFGGKSRMVYHGVASILPDTAPKSLTEATNMLPGRLNLTFRMY